MLIPIKDDLFCIAKRLRYINRAYQLFFNNRTARYQVHDGGGLCFVVPFAELDERTLNHAQRTLMQNFDELEAEVNANNRELTDSANKSARQSALMLGDMLRYADGQVHEVVFGGKQQRWI